MSAYQTLTTNRPTEPDMTQLVSALRLIETTCGVQHTAGTTTYTVKKETAWTGPQVAAAQTAIDTAPVQSAQLTAQAIVDAWPIEIKALVLALVDQINVLRGGLPVPLSPITPAQALAAIRTKAASL